MMNILVLNYEYPPLGGGAGNITKHISSNLVAKGHKVLVVTTWFEGLAEHEIRDGQVEVIRLKSRRKHMYRSTPLEMISWMAEAKKFLDNHIPKNKFDFCLANFSIPGGAVGKYIKRKFGIPYGVLSHGHDIPWYYKRQMFFYHVLSYYKIKSVCKNASVNFIQTEFMKKNIDKFLGKKHKHKNVIIPNGVATFDSVIELKEKQPFTLLFVGRFVQQKDPLTLLKALRKISRMDIPYRIFLVGDGPMRRKMEKFVSHNKLDNVTFTGWIPQEKVIDYYKKAHAIITPSRTEGMSIANLEALSAGVFLIATPVSGNQEMLSYCKNGVLIEPGNHGEIANQLQKFYFEQYLPDNFIAQKNAKQFAELNSWSFVTDRYVEEITKILK